MSCDLTLQSSDSSIRFDSSSDDEESCPSASASIVLLANIQQDGPHLLSSSSLVEDEDYEGYFVTETATFQQHRSNSVSPTDEADDEESYFVAPSYDQEEDNPAMAANHLSMPSLCSNSSVSTTGRTVQVVAPAALPPGYQFVATAANHQEYLVEVFQPTGVRRGETFDAMIVQETTCVEPASKSNNKSTNGNRRILRAQPGHFVPFGYWRDGLFDCFRFGMLHPVVCLACWCSPLLLAQVMARMGLNVWGGQSSNDDHGRTKAKLAKKQRNLHKEDDNYPPTSSAARCSPFSIFAFIFVMHFLIVETALSAVIMVQIHARQEGLIRAVPTWTYFLLGLRATCRVTLLLYVVTLAARTRTVARTRYGIPEQHCDCGVEDAAVSLLCLPCSVAQVARHTADYETYDAICCAPTGLSPYAPPSV